jgi:outer membrane protein assembly factor BamB
VHITVHCPGCFRRYQLDPQMEGRQLQCPNPVCRTIFEVHATPEVKEESIYPLEPVPPDTRDATVPPAGKVSWTGSVGDLVPILEAAEVVDVSQPVAPADALDIPEVEAPREAPSWQQPPPVRKPRTPDPNPERLLQPPSPAPVQPPTVEAEPTTPKPPPRKKAPKTMHALPEGPLDPPTESWEPPPVRRSPEMETAHESEPPVWLPAALGTEGDDVQAGARRRSLWLIAVLSSVVVGLVGVAIFLVWSFLHKSEEDLFAQTRRDYGEARFASAAKIFGQLVKEFPTSEMLPTYKFFGELSETRSLVFGSDPQPEEASEKLEVFLKDHHTDPLLKEHKADVWETLLKVTDGLTALADTKHDRRLLGLAGGTLAKARQYQPEGPPGRGKYKPLEEGLARVEISIGRWEVLRRLLKKGEELARHPADETVQQFRQEVHREQLDQDSEIKALLAQLDEGVRQLIKYVEAPKEPTPELQENGEPSLLAVPLVDGSTTQSPPNERVFLALARGVLYALAQNSGDLLWATRVGIDTATLPVRLPVTPTSPEMVLVVSADRNTLRALDARSGKLIWQHELEQPCLGRPVVVRNRAYVPTYDGKVHELELVEGSRLGYFDLGQPLTVGGAWQEGTDLLYFPGDSRNVYVLRITEGAKGCVAILKSGHPSGSLRSEPLLINRVDPLAPGNQSLAWPSHLVLSQADGLNDMKLRVFQLPIVDPEAAPVLLPEPPIRGWSWFQPYHDAEKLAFATDAGRLGLFGINQIRNQDTPLYRELQKDYSLGGDTSQPRRAQVVHVDEQDFWVLANGELQHYLLNKFKQELIPLWDRPLRLGMPLHGSQVDETGNVLFVVTQSPSQHACLATAIDARGDNGRILWQRQLGVEVQGDALVLGPEVWILDRRGHLFAFDSRQAPRRLDAGWQVVAPVLAAAPEEGLSAQVLITSGDGTALYTIASINHGRRLFVRRCEIGQGANLPTVTAREVELVDTLGGTPCLAGDSLILPLANGSLYRLRLPLDGNAPEGGPEWRAARADEGASGYVVPFREDEILFTDGSSGLTLLRWGRGPDFKPLARKQMHARIVAAPVVLPRVKPDEEVQVCVADADGTISLLRGVELSEVRQWRLDGKITAGPFLRGGHIGCIVDQLRLVWLDPANKEPQWQYTMQGKGTQGIAGQPQFVGDSLILADLSGRFVALDPATGQPRGPVYTLQASAAPAATPVAFGSGQAFVPLSDGTICLLPLAYLREEPGKLPDH